MSEQVGWSRVFQISLLIGNRPFWFGCQGNSFKKKEQIYRTTIQTKHLRNDLQPCHFHETSLLFHHQEREDASIVRNYFPLLSAKFVIKQTIVLNTRISWCYKASIILLKNTFHVRPSQNLKINDTERLPRKEITHRYFIKCNSNRLWIFSDNIVHNKIFK